MIVYDIEIEKSPKIDKNRPNWDRYRYANGWDDHKGMGVAVIGWFNYDTAEYGHSLLKDINKFQAMIKDNLVIGFNNDRFDDAILRAIGLKVDHSYDILKNMWYGAGLSDEFNFRTHGGFSLDKVYKANIGDNGKSGNGADAPFLWQDGEYQKVIDYCINDVRMTVQIMDEILGTNALINPKNGKRLKIASPVLDEVFTI